MVLAAALLAGAAAVVSRTDVAEAALATSPLVGAETLEEAGVGTVVEVLPAGSYTYFRLVDDTRWFVTTRPVPAPGSAVAWTGFAATEAFHSRRLDRQFHHVVFASIDTPEAP
jgi:hypothetical protein